MIEKLFFELVRVTIGTQIRLSRIPSEAEWKVLFEIAVRQSLVGVCFIGLHRLGADSEDGFVRIGMSEDLFINWMGMAARINVNNDAINQNCVTLQKRLSVDGFCSCVLKGQGIAALYREDLQGFRQSGDIDLWVDASKKDVIAWAMKVGMTKKPGYLHVGIRCVDTIVELHYIPTYLRSFRHNRRLQAFCESQKDKWTERNGMKVPSWEFYVVYQLSHIFRHLFGSGVGLRHLMDYYYLLCSRKNINSVSCKQLKYLGLYDFARAVMYVLCYVFHIDERYLICPVDEKRGKMFLKHIDHLIQVLRNY